jgi:hypothetical protein
MAAQATLTTSDQKRPRPEERLGTPREKCQHDVMTAYGYDLDMARQKVTFYLDPKVLQWLRVAAARRGKKDSELVEEALKELLGMAALDGAQAANAHLVEGMTEDEILQWAVDLVHEVRRESA